MVQEASQQALAQLPRSPVVPMFYHSDAAYTRQRPAACYAAGVRVFEFANRGREAPGVFADLRATPAT